ncbi:hypothetical protein DFJ77DRAFT_187350 [Powellomyces hirtus]|nr:hypothetical protein DFJ77DRAFT_187350 [Powellomyces hirtus]
MFGGPSKRWSFLPKDRAKEGWPPGRSDTSISARDWNYSNTSAAATSSSTVNSLTSSSNGVDGSTATLLNSNSNSNSNSANAVGSPVAAALAGLSALAIDTRRAAMGTLEGEGAGAPGKTLLELCQEGDEQELAHHAYHHAGAIIQSINVALDPFGNTLLHLSVSMKDLVLSSLFLLKGADANAANKGGVTPTVIAQRMKFTNLLNVLVKHGGVVGPVEEERSGQSAAAGQGRRKSGRTTNTVNADVVKKRIANNLELLVPDTHNAAGGSAGGGGASPTSGPLRHKIPTHSNQLPQHPHFSNGSDGDNIYFTNLADPDGLEHEAQQQQHAALQQQHPPSPNPHAQLRFPTYRMPLHDAAYLGIAADQIPLVPKHYLTHPDELGSTPLMKAAAKGHLHIVEALLARSVDLNAVDRFGNTALVWAAYAGKRDVVKELTAQKHCLINGHRGRADPQAGGVSATPPTSSPTLPDPAPGWTYQNAMTPLIAASIAGHPSIIEHLLDCGAAIDLASGPSRTHRTAVMYAAWMRREDCVRILVRRGCAVDPDTDHWLKKGLVYLKRVAMDYNVWTGCPGNFNKLVTAAGGTGASATATSTIMTMVPASAQSSSSAGTLVAGGTAAAAPTTTTTLNRGGRRMSLKDKMSFFSSDENQAIVTLEAIMAQSTSHPMSPMSPTSPVGKSHGSLAKSSASLFSLSEGDDSSGSAAEQSQNGTSTAGGGGQQQQQQNQNQNPTSQLRDPGNTKRNQNRLSRQPNRYRHGMNFDKLIGQNPEVVAELTEQIPDRGTELDALWVQVFQYVIQLLIAANQNKKPHYIIISAKAIHHAGEIVRAIESAEKQAAAVTQQQQQQQAHYASSNPHAHTTTTSTSSSTMRPPSPSSTITAGSAATMFTPAALRASASASPEHTLFAATKVRMKMKELARMVNGELPKQLMLTTRIAIGVWPPQHAMSDMIKAATDLARTCREITDVANLTGIFQLVDRPLEVQFTQFETEDEQHPSSTHADKSSNPTTTTTATTTDSPSSQQPAKSSVPASLTYEEYKRQNDLKVLEEISKQSSSSRPLNSLNTWGDTHTPARTVRGGNGVGPAGGGTEGVGDAASLRAEEARQAQQEQAADQAFFTKLDDLVRALVDTMKEIKLAFTNHLKHQYVSLTSTAAHRAEVLIDEVRGYDLLADFPEDLLFDADDAAVLKSKGVAIGAPDDVSTTGAFPITVADMWYAALSEVRLAARNVTMKGKLASGVMPPPNAAEEMVRSTIPCLLAVKKLVTIGKESAMKIRRTSHDKVTKQEKWERDVAQNEHVKHLFMLWERQVLLPSQEGDPGDDNEDTMAAPSAEVDVQAQEMELLRDDLDGLVLESSGDSKLVVRGGKLTKLVEWMTSHIHYDPEFTANLLLTHHSFTTTSELLDLLFRRYTLTAPPALSRSQYDTYLQRKIFPVKQRVCTVLKTWLEMLFDDDFMYGDHHVGVFKLRDFCADTLCKDSEAWGRDLMHLVEVKLNQSTNPPLPPPTPLISGPAPKLPRLPPETDILSLLTSTLLYADLDPLELARQLAILDQSHFAKIKPHECLDQIWGEKRRKEMGLGRGNETAGVTGLGEMIRHTNVVTIWIANCIIRNDDLKARRDALKYFAQMAVHCHELNNFNGITALNAAMSTAAVNRLHKTWDAFREKYPKLYEAYEDAASTVSPKGQYANYRKVLKELAPPAVPFLGVSLTDLTFTELGNPDFLPDTSLINFDKRRKVYQILTQSIQKYQAVPYPLVPVSGIRDFLSGLGSMQLFNDDELYDWSLKVEPKEEELSDEEGMDDGPKGGG